jgi:hypothetical protein
MAMMWLPLDGPAIDGILALARSPWAPADLDATWALTGWPRPDGKSVSALVFDEYEFTIYAGDRPLGFEMSSNTDAIESMALEFVYFFERAAERLEGAVERKANPEIAGYSIEIDEIDEIDDFEDDPRELEEFALIATERGWRLDLEARRPRFDEIWEEGRATIANRLGPPEAVGRHTRNYQHAVWRVGSRLLVVAQGEDFGSYSRYDTARAHVVDGPPDAPLPSDMWQLLW